MKIFDNILFIGLLSTFVFYSCEKENIDPIIDEPTDVCEANLPSDIISGLTVKAGSSIINKSDTANLYLRPVGGGEDIKINYGDRYAPKSENGLPPFSPIEIVFTPDESIPDGEYQLVIKNKIGDIIVKRTSVPPFGNYDDYEREDVTTDNMRLSRVSMDDFCNVYSVGQNVLINGSSIKKSDRIVLISGTQEIEVEFDEISEGNYGKFIIPSSCSNGKNYTIGFLRRGQILKLGIITIKQVLPITNIELPSSPVSSQVIIKCNGANSSDKIILSDLGGKKVEVNASISDTGIQFDLPAEFSDGLYLVQLFRLGEPLFNLGYISTNEAIDIVGIPEDGIGSIPDELPMGYPHKAAGKDVNLTLMFKGIGFSSSDKIKFNNKTFPVTMVGNGITFTLNTQGVNGERNIELIRGASSKVLKTVNVISAPKLGDYAQGGVVFWIDPVKPVHGLVCDIKDYTDGNNKTLKWSTEIIETITMNKSIYSSKENSELIIAKLGDKAQAVNYCTNLKVESKGVIYDDWVLPSTEALRQMILKKDIINYVSKNNGGTALNTTKPTPQCHGYASSTQVYSYACYSQAISEVDGIPSNILTDFFVRAVRSF